MRIEQQRLQMERDKRVRLADVESEKEIKLAELILTERKLERNGSGSEADSNGKRVALVLLVVRLIKQRQVQSYHTSMKSKVT